MKTKEVKRREASERRCLCAEAQLSKLNKTYRRATKERTKIATILNISLDETYGYDWDGSVVHKEKCTY
jgi:hypothetical protein